MLVYCDSCIPIYYYDHTGPLNVRTTDRLRALTVSRDQIAVSDLV